MTSRTRFLRSEKASSSPSSPTPPPAANGDGVDSDFVVILAALLCALICVLGLVAVVRCAWLRRLPGGVGGAPALANKGLKKKAMRSLPKVEYSPEKHAGKLTDDCAICLSEFAVGEEIRVLPQCGHGFHVSCIDTWLGSHSSCPSCRQILAVSTATTRCQKCGGGGFPQSSSATSSSDAAPPVGHRLATVTPEGPMSLDRCRGVSDLALSGRNLAGGGRIEGEKNGGLRALPRTTEGAAVHPDGR